MVGESAIVECILCGSIVMDQSGDFCSTKCKTRVQSMRFKIVRMFFEGYPDKVIKRGLTLEEARAWCKNPETSSSTAKSKKAQGIFEKYGEWYDGFAEDSEHSG